MKYTLTTFSLIGLAAAGLLAALPLHAETSYNFNNGPEVISKDAAEDDMIAPPQAAAQTVPQAPSQAMAPMPGYGATDVQVRLQAMDAQARAQNGQIEKLNFSTQQLQQQMQRMASDNEVRFQQLEKRITALEEAAKAQAAAAAPPPTPPATEIPAKAEAPAGENGAQKLPEKAADKPAENLDAPPKKADEVLGTLPAGKGGSDAQKDYDASFAALRHAKYDEAEAGFKAFLKNYPKHKLTENAKYWLAESYYARGKYTESAVAFAETYQEFPKGSKAPDNLLKMAMSLGQLGKKPDACSTLDELKKLFPAAPAIIRNRAAQEGKSLQCP